MASEQLISQYIDREGIRQDTDFLLDNLKKVYDQFNSLKEAKNLFAGFSTSKDFVSGLKQLNTELDKSVKLSEKETKAALQSAKAKTEEARAAVLAAKAKTEEAKAAKVKTAESEREARAEKAKAKIVDDATNEYKQLSAAYNEAALKAKNYYLTLGESNPITKEAVENAKLLGDKLKAADFSVGQFQRNVGNYSSAFQGLNLSVAQITRELPSAVNSLNTFFLAISNNLPIFFDQVGKAKNTIAELRAEGKQTPSLIGQIGKAFFSLQTALSLGILGLTIYGKDIVEFFVTLVKGKPELDKFAEKLNAVNEAYKDSSVKDAIKNVEDVGAAFALAREGVIKKEVALKTYNEKLGEVLGKATSLEEAEKLYADKTDRYVQATILRAAAAKELDKIVDATLKLAELRNKQEDTFTGFFDVASAGPGGATAASSAAVKKQAEENRRLRKEQAKLDALVEIQNLKDIRKQILKEAADVSKGLNFDLFDPTGKGGGGKNEKTVKFFDDELKYAAEQAKKLSELEVLSLKQRIEARKNAFDIEQKILSGQRAADLENAKGDKDQILEINRKFAIDRLRLADDLVSDLDKIQASYLLTKQKQLEEEKKINDEYQKEAKDAAAKQQKAELDGLKETLDKRTNYLQQGRDIELRALEDRRNKGELSEKDYQKQRLEIENTYTVLLLKAELEYTEDFVKLAKARGEDVTAAEAKIAEIRLKLARATNDGLKKEEDDAEKRRQKLLELATETINLIESVVTGAYERQKNAIQDQIDLLDEKKKKEIEAIQATTLSEQDKAAKISIINARAAAEKEALERKQRILDQQKARFERAASIARVVQETAIQVIKYFGTPLGIIAAVIGAAQIATILAQPIPRYKHGRRGGPAELAIVGDGGVPEVIEKNDGSLLLTPGKDTLTFLERGDKVHANAEKFFDTANKLNRKNVEIRPLQSADNDLGRYFTRLERTIASKRENYISLTDRGFRSSVKQSGAWTHYINKNIFE